MWEYLHSNLNGFYFPFKAVKRIRDFNKENCPTGRSNRIVTSVGKEGTFMKDCPIVLLFKNDAITSVEIAYNNV